MEKREEEVNDSSIEENEEEKSIRKQLWEVDAPKKSAWNKVEDGVSHLGNKINNLMGI